MVGLPDGYPDRPPGDDDGYSEGYEHGFAAGYQRGLVDGGQHRSLRHRAAVTTRRARERTQDWIRSIR